MRPKAERASVSYAVQLLWSVQPIDFAGVPAVDILQEYTLYTTESSRAVPKWYALRLGFFSNAISAKQVALYLRSQFTSVAVIPISETERSRALRGASPKERIVRDNVQALPINVRRTPEFQRLLALLRQLGDRSHPRGRGR